MRVGRVNPYGLVSLQHWRTFGPSSLCQAMEESPISPVLVFSASAAHHLHTRANSPLGPSLQCGTKHETHKNTTWAALKVRMELRVGSSADHCHPGLALINE